jgi:hypothetical protein
MQKIVDWVKSNMLLSVGIVVVVYMMMKKRKSIGSRTKKISRSAMAKIAGMAARMRRGGR